MIMIYNEKNEYEKITWENNEENQQINMDNE
jgi:hypothetical protein